MRKIIWKKFDRYHWRTEVEGKSLDYWPTKRKWRYNGETQTQLSAGKTVDEFIADIASHASSEGAKEERSVEKRSFWAFTTIEADVRIYIAHENLSKPQARNTVLRALNIARASYQSA